MKKVLSVILTIALLAAYSQHCFASTDVVAELADNNTEFAIETAEIIKNAADSQMLRIIGKAKFNSVNYKKYGVTNAVISNDGRFVFQFSSQEELSACLEDLKNNPDVIYAEKDVPVFTAALEEASEDLSWGVSTIEADIYSSEVILPSENATATVAIIDSGCKDVDFVKDKLVQGFDFIDNDSDATNDTSTDSHGTFLASIVTDCTKSLPVKIMPVRVLSSKSGTLINCINGIRYAVDNGADVINISLGGVIDDCKSLDDALAYAEQNGVTVVVCAGNTKSDIYNYCPAHNEDAITVSSVNESNEFSEWFSNYGDNIDIAAPGENITGYNASGAKVNLNGTSMSAAFVSAAAAMFILNNPDCTTETVRTALAQATEDFGEPGWDRYYGHGVLRMSMIEDMPKTYTVEWNINGSVQSSSFKTGQAIIPPELPDITGYTFAQWSPTIPSAMPAENLSFTAIYKPNKYNATFNANGGAWADGSDVKTVAVDYSAAIPLPDAPSKEGFVFSGWSPNPDKMDSTEGKTFTAEWQPSESTNYTVETYTMNPEGEYEKSSQAFNGTTGSEAKADYAVEKGFALNSSKSILSGTVAPNGSLVLKVYIDRDAYEFTTVVDGISSSTQYLYGAVIASPAEPSKAEHKFIKWDSAIPETMPANNITVTAIFEKSYNCPDCGSEILGETAISEHIATETKMKSTVEIIRNPESATINYGETLRLKASCQKTDDTRICWFVDGVNKSEGETFDLTFESGTKTVEVKLVDVNGNVLKDANGNEISDSQKVTVKSGFWQKIISFFKNLFSIDRTVVQTF